MTNSDGYDNLSLSNVDKFKSYSADQLKINLRLKEIAKEISALPKIPDSVEEWVDIWAELDKKNFGLNDYRKHLKIKKEYNNLLYSSEKNLREMKILTIEELINKINDTLDK